uniref:Tubby C-terminal domain-containing protein n=1 Tax=Manihot esculenta TaxID=3983 RepID=A0A2C9WCT4_MANES
MGKIHPLPAESSSSSSSSYISLQEQAETFTVWMKSLVMQTNGCTVFNQNGDIVYRVDNYDKKGSREVYLMDLKGTVLFTIRKLWLFRQWKGYKCDGLTLNSQKPFFQVRKTSAIFKGDMSCEIVVRSGNAQDGCYKLETSAGKSAFKIKDSNGTTVAKATRKQTSSGIVLGDDVLNLVVEPQVDHSFIMALVTVYGLIHHKL